MFSRFNLIILVGFILSTNAFAGLTDLQILENRIKAAQENLLPFSIPFRACLGGSRQLPKTNQGD